MANITLESVTKQFPDGTLAVDHVSLEIEDGEFFVLVGPSGCGKSTLLRMVPEFTSSRPASMRSDVDLPQPDGPTRTRNSPSPISMLSLSTAGRSEPGKIRVASSYVTVAMTELPSPAGTCRTIRVGARRGRRRP